MKIKIVVAGHKSEKVFKEYETDLVQRISPYVKLSIMYVSKEEEFFKHLDADKIYLLDPSGKELNSNEFSSIFANCSNIAFLIGPHTGFSIKFKERVKDKVLPLSLSKLTFPHRLCKVILMEQIYRGFCILNNMPYAK